VTLYESAIASRFLISRKSVALQLSTFATVSVKSGHGDNSARCTPPPKSRHWLHVYESTP
jgi:hypothetical protein